MQTMKMFMFMTMLMSLKVKNLGSSNNRGKSDKRVVDSRVGHLVIIIAFNLADVRKSFVFIMRYSLEFKYFSLVMGS